MNIIAVKMGPYYSSDDNALALVYVKLLYGPIVVFTFTISTVATSTIPHEIVLK